MIVCRWLLVVGWRLPFSVVCVLSFSVLRRCLFLLCVICRLLYVVCGMLCVFFVDRCLMRCALCVVCVLIVCCVLLVACCWLCVVCYLLFLVYRLLLGV